MLEECFLVDTTIVIHSKDDEGVGVAHKVISPKTSLKFPKAVLVR